MEICKFEKKETVERFVTALYTSGAYNPAVWRENTCLACGFTMDAEDCLYGSITGMGRSIPVNLTHSARFCPICGSRFNKEAEFGLYPEGLDPREDTQITPLVTGELSEEEYKELIGEELFARLAEQSGEKQ